jgi:hypothetical protein
MDGSEFLQRLHSPEILHRRFPFSDRQVAIVDAIVGQQSMCCSPAFPSSVIAARYERRPSVVMLSGLPYRFIALLMNFSAAALSHSFVTTLSSTSPSWSTARQSYRISPFTFTRTSSRCHCRCQKPRMRFARCRRLSLANSGPNLLHHNRTDSWLISMTRSWIRSWTFLNDSGYFTYISTARRITSGGAIC